MKKKFHKIQLQQHGKMWIMCMFGASDSALMLTMCALQMFVSLLLLCQIPISDKIMFHHEGVGNSTQLKFICKEHNSTKI